MANTTVLTATFPDGTTAKRRTHRTYSHIIAAQDKEGLWWAACWCGRFDLAEKQLAAHQIKDGCENDWCILAVNPVEARR